MSELPSKRIEQYKKLEKQYSSFAQTVEHLLKKIATSCNVKVQTQSRAKSVSSLADKLQKPEFQKRRLQQIYDLAAARCILYLEDDLAIFTNKLKEAIGYDQIADDKTKFSLTDYNARHIILIIKTDLIAEISFAEFKGMRCEIQLTTSLLHPWNEISHSMLYKDPERIDLFAPEEFEQNKKDLVDVVNKHLWEASHKLNVANRIHKELIKAKHHFSHIGFQQGLSTKDYNTALSYVFDTKKFLETYRIFKHNEFDFVSWSYELREKWANSDFKTGEFRYPHVHITTQEIVHLLRYAAPLESFYFLLDDYFSQNEQLRRGASEKLVNRFKINSWTLNNFGFGEAHFFIDEVESWTAEERISALELTLSILKHFLKIEFHDTDMADHKTFTLQHKILKPSHHVSALRLRVLNLLFHLYDETKLSNQKKKIITQLIDSGRIGPRSPQDSDIYKMITSEFDKILYFFQQRIDLLDLEMLRYLDAKIFYIPKGIKVRKGVSALRRKIAQIPDFDFYKKIIASPEDYRDLDYSKREELIAADRADLAFGIIYKDFFEWKDRLEEFHELIDKEDALRGIGFGQFINTLATCNPDFGKFLLSNSSSIKSSYFYPLLLGLKDDLSTSKKKKFITKGIKAWSSRIGAIRAAFGLKLYSKSLVSEYLKVATDSASVNLLLTEVHMSQADTDFKAYTFLRCLKLLNTNEACDWPVWWDRDFENILPLMKPNDLKDIVINLTYADGENYHLQQILIKLSNYNPDLVLDYFESQIERGATSRDFPYEMKELSLHLRSKGINVVTKIIDKINIEDHFDPYQAILNLLVPVFTKDLEDALIKKLSGALVENISFVLDILKKYSGNGAIDKIVLEIVSLTKNSEEFTSDLITIVEFYREVYSGEFGRVNIQQGTLARVKAWKPENQYTGDFQKRMIKFLEKSIADEDKYANSDVAQRRINFGRQKSLNSDGT